MRQKKRLGDPILPQTQKLLKKGAPLENKLQRDSGLLSLRLISKDRVTFSYF